jgi:hypothetical protein
LAFAPRKPQTHEAQKRRSQKRKRCRFGYRKQYVEPVDAERASKGREIGVRLVHHESGKADIRDIGQNADKGRRIVFEPGVDAGP